MNRFIILILILFCFWSMGFVDISEANKAILSSDYRGAIEKYRSIVEKGVEDKDLYYNLATSYLYMGEYGSAIFWYKKSELLSGSSDDISRNMRFAIQGLEEQGIVIPSDDSLIYKFILKIYSPYLTIIYIVLVNLLFIILILKRFSLIKRDMKVFTNILILLVFLFSVYSGLRIFYVHVQKRGVIIVKSVEVKEGPSDAYKTVSQLSEGMRIRVKEKYGEFLLIEIPQKNLRGWIPENSAGILKVSKI